MSRIPLTLALLCFFYIQGVSQSVPELSLKEALITLAKSKNLSFLYEPSILPDINVPSPDYNLSSEKIITELLRGTKLQFKLKGSQLYLFLPSAIYGTIQDGSSGEKLAYAVIKSLVDSTYAIANQEGYFSITTTAFPCALEVSYLGYADSIYSIASRLEAKALALSIYPDNQLQNIVITDDLVSDEEKKYIELDKGSDLLIFQNQANAALGGEPDVFQAMMRQTGVATGADGIGGLHVRGGKNGQNMVLYDGVRIYNPNHAFGLYSVINNSVVGQAKVYKSGASGPISGTLSSIMDIKLKDPDVFNTGAMIQVSTIASQASVNLPIVPSKVAISVTGRRTHLDPLIKNFTSQYKENNGDFGFQNFHFYDLNAKLKAIVSSRQKIFITAFRSGNRYFDQVDEDYQFQNDFSEVFDGDFLEENIHEWKNNLLSIRFNQLLGKKSILNVTGSFYKYSYDSELFSNTEAKKVNTSEPYFDRYESSFNADITDYNLNFDFETILESHNLRYGLQLSSKIYDLGTLAQSPDDITDHSKPIEISEYDEFFIGRKTAQMATLYLSDKIKISPRNIVDAGVYIKTFESKNVGNDFFQPIESDVFSFTGLQGYLMYLHRINANFHLGGSFHSSLQLEHLLTPADNGYPNDIWIPSSNAVLPQRGIQGEVFVEYLRGKSNLRMGLFYREQYNQNLIDFLPPILSLNDFLADEWESDILLGTIDSKGLEIDYTYEVKNKFAFHIAYTLMESFYQNEIANEGFEFPYEFSIPHTLSLGMSYQLPQSWLLNIDWYYASGKPISLYETYIDFSPLSRDVQNNVESISGYNDYPLPPQHKLSLSFAKSWQTTKIQHSLSLGIQNIYNRRNAIYQYENDEGLQTFSSFPIAPLFRWQISSI